MKVYNRQGDLAMDVGGRRAYFGTGSDLMNTYDGVSKSRHRSTLEDVRRSARVCDALPNIDFIMSFAHPKEIEPSRAYLERAGEKLAQILANHTPIPIAADQLAAIEKRVAASQV